MHGDCGREVRMSRSGALSFALWCEQDPRYADQSDPKTANLTRDSRPRSPKLPSVAAGLAAIPARHAGSTPRVEFIAPGAGRLRAGRTAARSVHAALLPTMIARWCIGVLAVNARDQAGTGQRHRAEVKIT